MSKEKSVYTPGPLSFLRDSVFKAVFTKDTDASKGALRHLISAIIEQDIDVIELAANEPAIYDIHDRKIRYDIQCKVRETQEIINIEITLYPDSFEEYRLEYLASRLFSSQDISGKGRSFSDLRRSFQISFFANRRYLADQPMFGDEPFLHTFQYYDPERSISLGGQIRIITVELYKLGEVIEKPVETMSEKERWAVFFQYHEDAGRAALIQDLIKKEEGIEMAQEVYSSITQDENERYRLMSEWKYEMDIQSKMVSAERALKSAEKELAKEKARAEQAEKEIAELRKQIHG